MIYLNSPLLAFTITVAYASSTTLNLASFRLGPQFQVKFQVKIELRCFQPYRNQRTRTIKRQSRWSSISFQVHFEIVAINWLIANENGASGITESKLPQNRFWLPSSKLFQWGHFCHQLINFWPIDCFLVAQIRGLLVYFSVAQFALIWHESN